jgi:diguanylate cyclase (GGDEF)-like protein/PAS domain S-box-containing protein
MPESNEAEEDFILRVLAHCPAGIAVIDYEGIFLKVNPAYCAIYGYDIREMLGASFTMVFPREDRESILRRHQTFLTDGGSLRGEWDVLRRDGSHLTVLSESVTLPNKCGKAYRLVYVVDITDRKQAEENLQIAAAVFDTCLDAILVTDADNRIISVNPAFSALTGFSCSEIQGMKPGDFKSGRHGQDFYLDMWQAIQSDGHWQGEVWDRKKNGEIYLKDLTINVVKGRDGGVLRHIGIFSDITDRKHAEQLIWHQANFDPLTDLPNRYMFEDSLFQLARKSNRSGNPLALLMIDLDRFKGINDSLGHHAGDHLLVEVARRITSRIPDSDMVARLGGDEFAIVLSELQDVKSIDNIAASILDQLRNPVDINGEVVFVSASIGIAIYPNDTHDLQALFQNADQAMYAAKAEGRNRFRYFTPVLQEAALQRLRLASALRTAVAEQQFVLHYQPIIDLASGRIHKGEALVRWQHPSLGMVSPADFIPLAEETGLIVPLGDWVFQTALSKVMEWRMKYHPEFQISVNKSPVQFINDDISASSWFQCMQDAGVGGNALVVEITEGLLLNTEKRVTDKLLHFRNSGIQVAIDDFGTGYSSLAYLQKFDIDYLKIDRSFVSTLTEGNNVVALCEAMIVMAHKLGLKVIAEGVETEQQRAILTDIGCDYGQGYLFSRPVPAEDFERMLQQLQQSN